MLPLHHVSEHAGRFRAGMRWCWCAFQRGSDRQVITIFGGRKAELAAPYEVPLRIELRKKDVGVRRFVRRESGIAKLDQIAEMASDVDVASIIADDAFHMACGVGRNCFRDPIEGGGLCFGREAGQYEDNGKIVE